MLGPIESCTVCRGARIDCAACRVKELAICAVLSEEERRELAAIGASSRLSSGDTLFYEGDPAGEVFTLTSGVLKLYKLLQDGRRQITGFLLPGDFLGLAFADRYICTAEAVTVATVCRFRRTAFLRLVHNHPQLEHNLLSRATSELAAAQEQMLLLGRKTAAERVASFLLKLETRLGGADGGRLDLPMTRTDMADFLGLTIETVSRTLSQFRRRGLIALSGKSTIFIRDRDRLAAHAGG